MAGLTRERPSRLGRLAVAGVAREVALPPADVPPGSLLEADPPVDAHGLEPAGRVQPDARVVGQRDAGQPDPVALVGEQPEQRFVQGAPGATPLVSRVDVHAHLGRPTVGGALAVRAAVCVAEELATVFGHHPGVGFRQPLDARGHLGRGRWYVLERDDGVGDVGRVDRRDRVGVSGAVCSAGVHGAQAPAPCCEGPPSSCQMPISLPAGSRNVATVRLPSG